MSSVRTSTDVDDGWACAGADRIDVETNSIEAMIGKNFWNMVPSSTGAALQTLYRMQSGPWPRGGLEGGDFGVVAEVVLVPDFAGELAVTVEEDAADGGVGRGEGDASAGEREGALHPVGVLVGGGHAINFPRYISFCRSGTDRMAPRNGGHRRDE